MRMILEIVSGPFGEREHADLSRFLTWLKPGDTLRVGRSGFKSDMAISGDQRMSSGHFTVSCEDDGCYISDMDSTNGTLVNGQRIVELTRLHDGDEIVAGNTKFRVQVIDPNRSSNTSLELERFAAAGMGQGTAEGGSPQVSRWPQFAVEIVSGPGISQESLETETLRQGWLRPYQQVKIGSSRDADFVIEGDPAVAAVHVTLEQRESVCHMAVQVACESVLVNNIRVREAELIGGERFTVGKTTLLLRVTERQNAPPTQVPPKSNAAEESVAEADHARHIAALSSGNREQVVESLTWFENATPTELFRDKICQKIATFTRSSDQELRRRAAACYARWASAKGQATLLQLIGGNDPVVLASAIQGLVRIGEAKNVASIAQVLKDPSRCDMVRQAIVSEPVLGEEFALHLLLYDDEQVQLQACEILAAIGGKRSELPLQTKVQRSSGADQETIRTAAQQALEAVRAHLASG